MTRHSARKAFLTSIAVLLGLMAPLQGQSTSQFTDGDPSDSNWTTADNWDPAIPDDQTDAYIGGGKTAKHAAGTAVAQSLTLGDAEGAGTLNLSGGTLSVVNSIVNGAGASTLSVTGEPSLSVGGALAVDTLDIGYNVASGNLSFTSGTRPSEIQIGTSQSDRGRIIVGYTEGGGLSSDGVLNLAEVPKLTAYLNQFAIGWRSDTSGTGTGKGTVTLAEENSIDATSIVVAQNEYWNTDPGSTLTLGADNTFKVDTFTVAGYRAIGAVNLPTGGELNLEGPSSAAAANLFIANNAVGTTHDGVGTMDLSAGTFNATLNQLRIGFHASGGGSGTGTLSFADGEVTANSVVLGHTTSSSTGTGIGTLNMAGGSLAVANNVTLGTGSASSEGTINMTGGTFDVTGNVAGGVGTSTLNIAGGAMTVDGDLIANELLVGDNEKTATFTATFTAEGAAKTLSIGKLTVGANSGTGTFTAGSGSLTVTGNVTLGTDSATSAGTINMSGGTFDVTGNVAGGIGTSTLNIAGGAMTVDGNLIANELIVGDNGLTAGLTANGTAKTLSVGMLTVAADSGSGTLTAGTGSTVEIGSAAAATDLFIARKTTTKTVTGTVDLSAANSLVAHLGRLFMATQSTGDTTGSNTAMLKLGADNEIHAEHIILGLVDNGATTTTSATIELGQSNTIRANTLTIGGGKSTGTVKFADLVTGGVLNLGTEAARVDLNLGCNVPLEGSWYTGTTATGHLDGTGGTIHAWLDEVVVGYHEDGNGKGIGALTLEDGIVVANSMLLGDGTGENPANNKGTIALKGGALRAGSITQGAGQAVFDWTGGTLSVDHFGFDLLQADTDGPSTLAPGNSIGTTTIDGNYTMNAGTLEIEIAASDDYDFVMVEGNATLAGDLNVLLLDDYAPALGTHFDVLQTTGELDISGLTLTGDPPGPTFGQWEMTAIPGAGGDGFLLRLSAVPEPSSAVMLVFAVAVLIGRKRRK